MRLFFCGYLKNLLLSIIMITVKKNTVIYIFTDGSSFGNPGPGGWGVIVVSGGYVRELGAREKHTTNNRMEILAVVSALKHVGETKKNIVLHTDSRYVINGITKWVHGWKRNNWKNSEKEEVKNRDLWEELVKATDGKKIEWKHVAGHVGILGNERADEIATSFSKDADIKLYDGNFSGYAYQNILDTSADVALKKMRIKKKKYEKAKVKAFSYLSLVDGILMCHDTWAECEARVKGKNAKYKKALYKEDEAKILKEWGVKQ